MKNLSKNLAVLIGIVLGMSTCLHAKSQSDQVPKNIIVFIADGWGYNQLDATKYWHGTESTCFEQFSTKLPMSTYCTMVQGVWDVDKVDGYTNAYNSYKAWTDWEWMKRESDGGTGATGSGAAATTMATGMKTAKYAIGVDINALPLELISERAINLGKASGVVTSVEFSHATPAGFSAHNPNRNEYVQIALSQLLDSKLTVLMGCGNPEYTADGEDTENDYKYVGGKATWNSLKLGATNFADASPSGNTTVQDIDGDGNPDAWHLIQDRTEFTSLSSGVTPKRVLGVPKTYKTLQHDRSGEYRNADPFEVPYTAGVPSLGEMTTAALNVLDNNDNEEGYFLMVEGGAIDWAGHGNSLARIIEEQSDFNSAVEMAIDWLEANGELENTLVIVTGDHETGYLTGDDFDPDNMIETFPVNNNGVGVMPGHKFMSNSVYGRENYGEHTNQLIPFFAEGPGADLFTTYADQEDFVLGKYIDNTDLAHVMFDLWPEEQRPEPKNVILMISDGWGYNQISLAEYYRGTAPIYKSFDYALDMSTFPATTDDVPDLDIGDFNTWYQSASAWTDADYINHGYTGSAPAATAMYTGVKSAKYAIGVDVNGNALKTFGERGFEGGKSVGVVTSVQFSHATPASMLAHNISRNNYADIANEMLIDSRAAVIFGCGAPDFNNDAQAITPTQYKYVGGEATWNSLLKGDTEINGKTVQDVDGDGTPDAWTLIRDRSEVINLVERKKTPARVLCIPKVGTTLNQSRSGDGSIAYSSHLNKNVPTLDEMTKAALNILDANDNGFSLMIEGGAVDWAGHANQGGRIIEEQADFDETVISVVKWIEKYSNWDETLLIVTGDHETGYLVGENFNQENIIETFPVSDKGKKNMPGYQFRSGGHTNQLIPIYMQGVGAEILAEYADHDDFVRGKYMDNSEIGQGVFKLWSKLPDGNPMMNSNSVAEKNGNKLKSAEIGTEMNNIVENIRIYPIPTNGVINIETPEVPALVKVYSASGKVIKLGTLTERTSKIDISDNKSGIYFIRIQSEIQNTEQKIVLQ